MTSSVTSRDTLWYGNGMVNVDLHSAIITKVSNALNTLVSAEKRGFQTLSKGLIVLLCAEVVRQRVPDHGPCTANAITSTLPAMTDVDNVHTYNHSCARSDHKTAEQAGSKYRASHACCSAQIHAIECASSTLKSASVY